jgi:hypothetical protein
LHQTLVRAPGADIIQPGTQILLLEGHRTHAPTHAEHSLGGIVRTRLGEMASTGLIGLGRIDGGSRSGLKGSPAGGFELLLHQLQLLLGNEVPDLPLLLEETTKLGELGVAARAPHGSTLWILRREDARLHISQG